VKRGVSRAAEHERVGGGAPRAIEKCRQSIEVVAMQRVYRLKNDERGFSLAFVALGFMGLLAASMLAIDVGMLMTARNQAQNSADAGALAGATALAYNDFDDRTPTGPAVTNALAAAQANEVMRKSVAVKPADVTFPNDPDGNPTRVKVNVFRTAARSSDGESGPVATLIAAIFRIPTADISATATAEASPADTMTCVKPFTIPDRWLEKDPAAPGGFRPSTGDDGFNPGVDIYRDPKEAEPTGYDWHDDVGLQITLKANNDTKIAPSFYYPWDMVGENRGADDYRWSIGHCNVDLMEFDQEFVAKPGNMVGPTKQGMDDLIDLDPGAKWDPYTGEVVNSNAKNGPSPRVVAIPLFDPVFYANGKANGRNASLKFVNYMGFFLEKMNGNEVVGRITPIGGLRKGGTPAPKGAFPRVIRLVQ
jgi:Flp pilus assembly protein TadG